MKSLRQQILETFKEYNLKVHTTWQKTNARIYGQRIYYLGFSNEREKLEGFAILNKHDFGVVDYDEKGVLVH